MPRRPLVLACAAPQTADLGLRRATGLASRVTVRGVDDGHDLAWPRPGTLPTEPGVDLTTPRAAP